MGKIGNALAAMALGLSAGAAGALTLAEPQIEAPVGSAVFLHVDGMGPNGWGIVRLAQVGPDGRLAWDQLPQTAVYVGPMIDSVTATSNGGATTHAWGVRSQTAGLGVIGGGPIRRARSGVAGTIAQEAQERGKALGLVNSSSITEAGTAAMLAVVPDRNQHQEIAAQMLAQAPAVLLGGGEQWFLPQGTMGTHGPGLRTDGRNLITEARAAGYTVVFTREELLAVPAGTQKLLGLFAAAETFHEGDERVQARGLPVFRPTAPRFDEMIAAALPILAADRDGFLLVGNEEATDDLAGDNNAPGLIEAGAGADRAIAVVRRFAETYRDLTIVTTADSDCGGAQASGDDAVAGQAVRRRGENGAPQDGEGPRRTPFLAAPDAAGQRLPFVVSWAAGGDVSGGLVARGQGPGAALVSGTIDSTDIYRVLYLGLFETRLD